MVGEYAELAAIHAWWPNRYQQQPHYHPGQIYLDDSQESGDPEIWKSRNLGFKHPKNTKSQNQNLCRPKHRQGLD